MTKAAETRKMQAAEKEIRDALGALERASALLIGTAAEGQRGDLNAAFWNADSALSMIQAALRD